MRTFDAIILDSVGVRFTGATPLLQGLGGSEFEQVLLAEGLAALGYKVACINKISSWARVHGVDYLPLELLTYEQVSCHTLVLERNSAMPSDTVILRKNAVRWVTDASAGVALPGEVFCVSDWQSQKCWPTSATRTIYNMLPDWVYELKHNRNTPALSFIYASAAMKGLRETVEYFASMKKTKEFKNATLTVLNPGYDLPSSVKGDGITFLGALSFRRVVEEMQKCRSLMHVSTFPETFGIVHVLAETLGLNVFVHQTKGKDALSEVCNTKLITDDVAEFNQNIQMFGRDPQMFKPVEAKDYRVSRLVHQWVSVLGLPSALPLGDGHTSIDGLELLVQPG